MKAPSDRSIVTCHPRSCPSDCVNIHAFARSELFARRDWQNRGGGFHEIRGLLGADEEALGLVAVDVDRGKVRSGGRGPDFTT